MVNVGDDTVLHGLHISPDIDTVIYTLAEAIDPERGWGLVDETWHAMAVLGRYGNPTWFNLGDQDLATHIVRTERLRDGEPLSAVTAQLARAWGLGVQILPVTDDPPADHGRPSTTARSASRSTSCGRQHDVAVSAVRFEGAASTAPAPGVLAALADADRVVIAPSNPVVSIGPLLAVPGVREAIAARRDDTVAVSPIVAGAALKGPAARMLTELGGEASVVEVARALRTAGRDPRRSTGPTPSSPMRSSEAGMACSVTDTIMSRPRAGRRRLCRVVLA